LLRAGSWSSQRHWHSHEDELVYLLEGEVTLIEDAALTVLGRCSAPVTARPFRKVPATDSDIDMMSSNADGRFVQDSTPYGNKLAERS
jgi:hypothetical protein